MLHHQPATKVHSACVMQKYTLTTDQQLFTLEVFQRFRGYQALGDLIYSNIVVTNIQMPSRYSAVPLIITSKLKRLSFKIFDLITMTFSWVVTSTGRSSHGPWESKIFSHLHCAALRFIFACAVPLLVCLLTINLYISINVVQTSAEN